MAAPLRAVLLDIDGTLLDSNDAQTQSWLDAFGEAGLHVEWERVRRLIGKGGDRLLREAVDLDIDAEPGKTVSERHKQIFAERYLAHCKPTHGARELLTWLRSRGLQLVVATSAGTKEMHALLRQAGVADLIGDHTSADDASETKPDPDIVGAALRKAAVGAEDSVMIGDTPYDCEAASRIGVPAIGLLTGGWSRNELGCETVFEDPADLLANYRASPLQRLDDADASRRGALGP